MLALPSLHLDDRWHRAILQHDPRWIREGRARWDPSGDQREGDVTVTDRRETGETRTLAGTPML
jgi:hypothetical protein